MNTLSKPSDLQGKKLAVLGLGVEGLSSAKWLTAHGANVSVLDRRSTEELQQEVESHFAEASDGKDVTVIGGEDYLKHLSGFDYIVRSPGIKRNLPELMIAEKQGAIITSQIKLFMDLCPCPVVGVTGTKGKGTTSSLIYEMLKKQGFVAYLGGNIGMPPLDFLDNLDAHSRVVLELSSFQLMDLTKSPHIAVMLMVTSEHLDWHADTYEYIEAKRNILAHQKETDFAIVNRDYPASHESDVYTPGKVYQVSRERSVAKGCYVEEGKLFVDWGGSQEQSHDVSPLTDFLEGKPSPLSPPPLPDTDPESEDEPTFDSFASDMVAKQKAAKDTKHREEILDVSTIQLPGKHNLENVCAATMAALLAGVDKRHIVSVLKSFKGLEHRLEMVGYIDGVRYYDDSFSTTPETAIAAIQSFEDPEILILGGSHKGSDFKELGNIINTAGNIKAIIGIGKEWDRIKEHIQDDVYNIKIVENVASMKQAVIEASDIADANDVVILSPACASFDMFKNYKDRGDQFKAAVKSLAGK